MGMVGRQVVSKSRPRDRRDIRQSMGVVGWRSGVQLEECIQEESFVKFPTLRSFVPPSSVQASRSLAVVASRRPALTRRQTQVAVTQETASVICIWRVNVSTQIVACGTLKRACAWYHSRSTAQSFSSYTLPQTQLILCELVFAHSGRWTTLTLWIWLSPLSRTCNTITLVT